MALLHSCTFPTFRVPAERDDGDGGHGGELPPPGGGAGSTGTGGNQNTGGSEEAGAAGVAEAEAGAAGAPVVSVGPETRDWSSSSLEAFGFQLLGSAQLEPQGVVLTRVNVRNVVGGLVQRSALQLTAEPRLEVTVHLRINAGQPAGDGMALVFHSNPEGFAKMGLGGGGLGYAGIVPCVAIEVDTVGENDADLPAPHLAVMPDCHPEQHGFRSDMLPGNPLDGDDYSLRVSWTVEGSRLSVELRNLSSGSSTTLEGELDLPTKLGPSAYVAVLSANGEFTSTHRVTRLQIAGGGLTPRVLAAASP